MRTVFVITCVWLAAIVLIGCSEADSGASSDASGTAGRTVSDDTGREIALPARVERIAAGASFAVEYLVALGHPPIARPNVPLEGGAVEAEQVASIPMIAIDHSVGPNIEQIAAAEPDVVVLSPIFARFAPTIEQASGAAVLIHRIDHLDDVPAKARAFGELIGDTRAGEALAGQLQASIDAIAAPAGAAPPTVFALFGTPEAYFAFNAESYLGSMIAHLGGRLITLGSPAAQTSSQLSPFSFEALVAADPDVILMVHHGPAGQMAGALRDRPTWAALRAVRHDRVHRVSERLFMTNPGPSAVAALRELRRLLYPEHEHVTSR